METEDGERPVTTRCQCDLSQRVRPLQAIPGGAGRHHPSLFLGLLLRVSLSTHIRVSQKQTLRPLIFQPFLKEVTKRPPLEPTGKRAVATHPLPTSDHEWLLLKENLEETVRFLKPWSQLYFVLVWEKALAYVSKPTTNLTSRQPVKRVPLN